LKEFYLEYYSLLTRILEFIAAITGILYYRKFKNTKVKYFIWFLIWVVIVELIGGYTHYLRDLNLFHYIEGTLFEKNSWWFTLAWTTSSTLFYSWFLGVKLDSLFLKRVLKFSCAIYLAILLWSLIFYFNDFFKARPMPLVIGNVIIILLSSIFYLYEILNTDRILTFYKSIYFYVAAIIFVWWLISTPLSFFDVYNTTSDWDYVVLKWTVRLSVNTFMYLGFAVALIVTRPEYDKIA